MWLLAVAVKAVVVVLVGGGRRPRGEQAIVRRQCRGMEVTEGECGEGVS